MKRIERLAAMGIVGMAVFTAFAEDAYVESDGTQAVNTGYFANPGTKVVISDLTEKSRDGIFYRAILAYEEDHRTEILSHTKGTLTEEEMEKFQKEEKRHAKIMKKREKERKEKEQREKEQQGE